MSYKKPQLSIAGNFNKLAKFLDNTKLANSLIDDNGNTVTIEETFGGDNALENILDIDTLLFPFGVDTASQTGAVITSILGVFTALTGDINGMEIIFADGTSGGNIVSITDSKNIVVTKSQTVALQDFKIIYAASSVSSSGSTGLGTKTPDAKAILDLESTTKGFLLPRLTAVQINAIVNPPKGLLVYDKDIDKLFFRGALDWEKVTSAVALR